MYDAHFGRIQLQYLCNKETFLYLTTCLPCIQEWLLKDQEKYSYRCSDDNILIYHAKYLALRPFWGSCVGHKILRDSNNLVGLNLFQPSFPFHIDSSHLICTIILLTAFYMKCDTGLKLVEYYTETHLLHFSCCLFDRFYSVFIWKPYAYDTLECFLECDPTTDISMPNRIFECDPTTDTSMPNRIIHKCLLT